jgi:hypothetical protein
MTITHTLQLIFDPADTAYTPFGRFQPAVPPLTTLSSQVWITDDGGITVDAAPPTVRIDGGFVSIRVIGALQEGYAWAADGANGFALRITSVFGRARGVLDTQNFASPFGVRGNPFDAVRTVFDQTFSVDDMRKANGSAEVHLGQAQFPYFSPVGPKSVYEFNVGATAFISFEGKTRMYMFGHDPDMNVGN